MAKTKTYQIHPLCELLPRMTEGERESMKSSLQANGQFDDIFLFQNKILEGRHRYELLTELGVAPRFRTFEGTYEEAFDFVVAKATGRNLTDSQKACVGARLSLTIEEGRKSGGKFATVEGKTRDLVGTFCGASPRYVQDAKLLMVEAPEQFDQVFTGATKLHVAVREWRRAAKAKQQRKQAKAHAKTVGTDGAFKILTGDMLKLMDGIRPGTVRLVATDPPYNEGIDYGNGAKADRRDPTAFVVFLSEYMQACKRILSSDGSIFVMMSSEYASDLDTVMKQVFGRECRRAAIIWHETFGTYQSGNFTECHRVIFYYTMNPTKYVWHGDQILIPSDRQTKHNDARANPRGKVPGDVWTEFPRLVENAAERVPNFPTQIPWRLMERIIKVASDPGDLVFDGCTGSGTTGEACLRNHRQFLGTELVPANADAARARLIRVAAEMAAGKKP